LLLRCASRALPSRSRLVVVHPDADFLADLQGELAGCVLLS
jgi:hypothetical protein